MPIIPTSFLYQPPSDAALKAHFLSQKIGDVQAPAAVIDVAVVRKNCDAMLNTANALKIQFRAHVKTHKTLELAKLQVGPKDPIRLIASTIAEIEHLLPWLISARNEGRDVNILYGVPASPSSLLRLATLARALGGPETVSLLVDRPEILGLLDENHDICPGPVPIFIKIDTGYHRCGTTPLARAWKLLLQVLSHHKTKDVFTVIGLYSHLGHSYAFSTPGESLDGLRQEFEGLSLAGKEVLPLLPPNQTLTFSVGATPTATAAQTLFQSSASIPEAEALKNYINNVQKSENIRLELHAGVYPLLDMQQLATHARSFNLSHENIGLRMLVEVASVYPDREKPEALIAAGSLVLGREPCKSYPGWGVVTPWQGSKSTSECPVYDEQNKTGWIVGRVSQEHGILSWEGPKKKLRELMIGEKLLIWPNHACVAGAGFGWYLVVDSDSRDPDVVRDVWVRCHGW